VGWEDALNMSEKLSSPFFADACVPILLSVMDFSCSLLD
jgi:hypothetical protein